MTGYLEDVKVLTENLNQDNITKILEDTTFQNVVLPLWSEFLYRLRNDNGELSTSWMSYIDLVEDVLLAMLHVCHEGDRNLLMSAICVMIP